MSDRHCTELSPGIRVLPLKTDTLPPATHTNAYLLGQGELLIVDPGSAEKGEQDLLIQEVRSLERQGMRPRAVFLTHHHADHVGGAEAVARYLSLGIWCHGRTADRLPFPSERLLGEGDLLTLDGRPPMQFEVLHTPGHAPGHLCLVEPVTGAAVVGDMVAGLGTILIDPPEGDMGEYLAQLRRLRIQPVGVVYPAHGPPIQDGPGKLSEYLFHRQMREARVLDAVSLQGATLEEITQQAYADAAGAHSLMTQRSTLAHLIKLERDGRIQQGATGRWLQRIMPTV